MGKQQCCAYGCNQTYVKNSPISLHVFPKDPERRKIWTRNLKRENFIPSDHTKICSKHFDEECFDKEKFGGRWLKPSAVPTIFNFPSHLQHNRKPPKKRSISPAQSSKKQEVDNCEEILPAPMVETSKKKRLSYLGDFKADVPHSPTKLAKRWEIAEKVMQKQKWKISLLQKKQKRLEKKVAHLSDVLQDLKKKDFISNSAKDTLEISMSGVAGELLKRSTKNNSKDLYSPELRRFALTLHFYSPKGYNYVRNVLNTCLPHPSTIRKWYGAVSGKPGLRQKP